MDISRSQRRAANGADRRLEGEKRIRLYVVQDAVGRCGQRCGYAHPASGLVRHGDLRRAVGGGVTLVAGSTFGPRSRPFFK